MSRAAGRRWGDQRSSLGAWWAGVVIGLVPAVAARIVVAHAAHHEQHHHGAEQHDGPGQQRDQGYTGHQQPNHDPGGDRHQKRGVLHSLHATLRAVRSGSSGSRWAVGSGARPFGASNGSWRPWSTRSHARAARGTTSTSPNGTSTGSQLPPPSWAAQVVSAATSRMATLAPTSRAAYRWLLPLLVTLTSLVPGGMQSAASTA